MLKFDTKDLAADVQQILGGSLNRYKIEYRKFIGRELQKLKSDATFPFLRRPKGVRVNSPGGYVLEPDSHQMAKPAR